MSVKGASRVRALLVAATMVLWALSALSHFAARPGQAQPILTPTPIPEGATLPMSPVLPTPIPLDVEPSPTPAPPTAPRLSPSESATFDPQATLLITWTPAIASVLTFTTIAPSVVVTVSSDEGDFDLSTAEFVPIVDDVTSTPVPISITDIHTVTSGGVHTLRLRAQVGSYKTGDRIVFRIRKQGDPTTLESPEYTLSKQYVVFLPILRTVPEPAGSACAAESGAYQLSNPSTPYFIARTRQDAWFYVNISPSTTQPKALQVWLTGYAPSSGGQLQVWSGASCSSIALAQPFGSAPNPTVTVVLTQPKVYARVVTVGSAPAPFTITWRELPDLQPSDNACDAQSSNAAKLEVQSFSYAVPMPLASGWFWAQNPINNGIVEVWLSDYTTSGHQLQVWTGSACGSLSLRRVLPLSSSVLTATVGGVPGGPVFFRVVGSSAPPPYRIAWRALLPTENTNACRAYPLPVGTPLNWPLRNSNDYFAIHVTRTGTIHVSFSNHPIQGAQLQLRSGLNVADCTTASYHGASVVSSNAAQLSFNVTVTGAYYIRNAMTASYPGTQQYTVLWRLGSPYYQPLFTTNPNQPYNGPYNGDTCLNIAPGGSCTYYWFGMDKASGSYNGQYDVLQVQIVGVNGLGTCAAGNPASVTPSGYANTWGTVGTPSTPDGSIAFTFPGSGGYNVRFRAVKNSVQVFYDAKPLKVGCQ